MRYVQENILLELLNLFSNRNFYHMYSTGLEHEILNMSSVIILCNPSRLSAGAWLYIAAPKRCTDHTQDWHEW